MYVIEVIPLTRGAHIESLTYYSGVSYDSGTIITVPVRNSEILALVIGVKPVSAAKTAVRAATFSLKKLPPQENTRRLPESLITTAKQLTKTCPAQIGAILFALLPPEVRRGEMYEAYTHAITHADIRPEVSLVQASYDDRFLQYRSKIREMFAHRGSIVLVVPSSQEIDRAAELLSHGIEDRLVVFSPTLTKKRLDSAYASFYDLSRAKLIVTTPTHAYLDRHDITHIIVDQSRSRHYKSKTRPYIDHRDALKVFAEVTNRTMTLGDILPSSEDEQKRRDEIYGTEGEHPKRLSLPSKLEVIAQKEEPTAEKPFTLISPRLHGVLTEALSERKRVFVYAARRGIAPLVVCADCGYVFRDPDSGTPYSLFKTVHQGEETRWFLSSVSGKRVRAADTCEACGSWRLRERGIGIQHIQAELAAHFKNASLHTLDHTTATTHKKAQQIVGRFYESKGSLLLGTAMALPYLEGVDISAITSLDAARSIPSWKAEEEFFALLLTLRERTKETVFLQTRTDPDDLIEHAKQGLVEHFYTEELQLRNALRYPPFAEFILLTWQDTRASVEQTEAKLVEVLKPWKPKCYSAPQSIAAKTRRHCLLRIPAKKWPDSTLMKTLRSIPPYVKIEVNPDRIV